MCPSRRPPDEPEEFTDDKGRNQGCPYTAGRTGREGERLGWDLSSGVYATYGTSHVSCFSVSSFAHTLIPSSALERIRRGLQEVSDRIEAPDYTGNVGGTDVIPRLRVDLRRTIIDFKVSSDPKPFPLCPHSIRQPVKEEELDALDGDFREVTVSR